MRNVSFHLQKSLGTDTQVLLVTNAPVHNTADECKAWRERVCKYVYAHPPNASPHYLYDVVYVPKHFADEGSAASVDEVNEVDEVDFQEWMEDICFVTKRPDPLDTQDLGVDMDIPEHYSVMAFNDIQDLYEAYGPKNDGKNEMEEDFVNVVLKKFYIVLLFIFAFAFALANLKLNPNTILGF